jgi:hypothetical protein
VVVAPTTQPGRFPGQEVHTAVVVVVIVAVVTEVMVVDTVEVGPTAVMLLTAVTVEAGGGTTSTLT